MRILNKFSTDRLIGKLCLLGLLAPVAAIVIRLYISAKTDHGFYRLSEHNAWELWIYFLCLIWFFIALFRYFYATRCTSCSSANNSKTGKREIERYDGWISKRLPGSRKFQVYDVPVTFIKTAFSFHCHHCQNVWETVVDIPVE